ncbi:MAG: ABC transporter ATP-binding protein [Cyanobacteria bacterium J06639_1]
MLRLEGVTKHYGDRRALSDLSLHVRPGEIYGLLGPNGAGKTTTINIMCNLLQPDSGTIAIAERPVSEATKPLVGIAPQENLLYGGLTCAENLDFFARIYGLSRENRRSRVQTCLEAVKLSDRADSVAGTLSGGMQRRLSTAIALIHSPKLVVLDEPTTGLDIEARYDIWSLIQQLKRDGTTVLLTTHLLEEAERLCDRIGILKQGCLLAEGSLDELRSRIPACEIVTLQTEDTEAAIAIGAARGFAHRYYGSELAFWLPHPLEWQEIMECFEGIAIHAIARSPVRLEHVYLEHTRAV